MKPITLLTALLVMLRVSGLAEIPWGWVFAPMIIVFSSAIIGMVISAARRK
ncbi:hypothetical protein H0A71_06515 [Alcaligenaceae bacterium]|nr:hypothetical protein [Alcaligenaceae bacterium]